MKHIRRNARWLLRPTRAHDVIDTAMGAWLSAIALSPVGIAAAIMATVLMSLLSVLLALVAVCLNGIGRR